MHDISPDRSDKIMIANIFIKYKIKMINIRRTHRELTIDRKCTTQCIRFATLMSVASVWLSYQPINRIHKESVKTKSCDMTLFIE